ncbi:serum response factor homolog A-like [Schistocerca gregaria]|uniref:serum response factor homolog A-like n=1 Tax=Schistocerca gregaria TaxID=7010 RepID=UPI00211DB6FF|nr:serum response factor homolog A-like [Schistocerca gregaria]XP_049848115.1 serum response factor homolog A-like [Schistocerca gregaria]XP_049848116.1 serum response factor homolog A-like [Schistocerca gregaria]XP_049848117.1 serum response factor homolog A-like [Schistocerca gregaria]XP_049848118.1 serum response factor homolog A-like [Schistocerca gregaria]
MSDDIASSEYSSNCNVNENAFDKSMVHNEATTGEKEKKKGRRKVKIEFLEDKCRRHTTFSKRKGGIMKKAWQLSVLTGTDIFLLVASETGHIYGFATPKLQPIIKKAEGLNLIHSCLNSTINTQCTNTCSSNQTSSQNKNHEYAPVFQEGIKKDEKMLKEKSIEKQSTPFCSQNSVDLQCMYTQLLCSSFSLQQANLNFQIPYVYPQPISQQQPHGFVPQQPATHEVSPIISRQAGPAPLISPLNEFELVPHISGLKKTSLNETCVSHHDD